MSRAAVLALAAVAALAACDGQIRLEALDAGPLSKSDGGMRADSAHERGADDGDAALDAEPGGDAVAADDTGGDRYGQDDDAAAPDAAVDLPADAGADRSTDGGLDRSADAAPDALAPGTCTQDSHCPTALRCDTASKTCVSCLGNTDCTTDSTRTRCDPTAHRCVECLAAGDCGSSTRTCTAGHRCATTCVKGVQEACPSQASHCEDSNLCSACSDDSSEGCPAGATPVCLLTEGVCVQCTSNGACGGSKPFCDLVTNTCFQCRSKDDCTPSAPFCNLSTGLCAPGR